MKKKWYVTVEDKDGLKYPLIVKSESKLGAEKSVMQYRGVVKVINTVEYDDFKKTTKSARIISSPGRSGKKISNKSGAYAT